MKLEIIVFVLFFKVLSYLILNRNVNRNYNNREISVIWHYFFSRYDYIDLKKR